MDYVFEKLQFKCFFLKPTYFKKLYFFFSFKSKLETHQAFLVLLLKYLVIPSEISSWICGLEVIKIFNNSAVSCDCYLKVCKICQISKVFVGGYGRHDNSGLR